ncbi:MAG: hypothetical protein LBV71_15510, partial [Prevotella sp.]|nr:hypothetical protein [Prevotella sp.]
MNKLQYHWDKQEIVGLDGIFFNSGKVQNMYIDSIHDERAISSYKKIYNISLNEMTDLSNLEEKYNDDIWSSFDIFGEIKQDDNSRFLYGEGEMGNEGFILKIDSFGKIIWSLYSTSSNPFINSKFLTNNSIGFFSSFNFILKLEEEN